MRLPLSWLADHVDPGLAPEQLAERLNFSGTAVERIVRRGVPDDDGNLDVFRVGKVLQVGPHPDADRLRLCQVDTGDEQSRQIVCGAPNVAAGQTVGVALPGAVMPGGRTLGVATLRGVESRGMILSEPEVELGADGAGIMVLDDALDAGARLADALPISEAVLELEITSNRPDCLSIAGLAREVHAVIGAPLRPLDESDAEAEGPGLVTDLVALEVEAPDLCPRYMARVLVDVSVGPSPVWLRARLEAAGMRPISNVVDVTNYVMLLTGQPLHAFDLDKVAGPRIVVRRAREEEPIVTLDGVERRLDPTMLAICDAEKPAVIAGIFGAATAEVGPDTSRVLLEAASFDGPTLLATSLALGIRTESSARFEKGLPRELPPRAMAIACRMLTQLCGARLVPGTLDACEPLEERPPIALRHARVDALLGVAVPRQESAEILRRLGFEVDEGPQEHVVRVSPERAGDVTREVDLIEEVGRIHGLEAVPAILPRVQARARRTPAQARAARLAGLAADLGLQETISYRFVPEADSRRIGLPTSDDESLVRLANPLSEEMAVMRRRLLPGLLRAVGHNQAHQRPDGGLVEIGRTYARREDGMADEREWLSAVVWGRQGGEGWRARGRPVDYWTAKGMAESLLAGVRVTEVESVPADTPYGHPAHQAFLISGGARVGWAGEVHPLVLRAFDVRPPVVALAIDLATLAQAAGAAPQFEDLLSVPASSRDLSLVVADDTDAAAVLEAAQSAGAPLVREARVVDRYSGDQVAAGTVSLSIRLTVADPQRTLTEEEIEGAVAGVVAALRERLGAELRA